MRPEPYAVRLLLAIQHRFNPLHVYCRLVDCRVRPGVARGLAAAYEVVIWSWVAPVVELAAKVCRKL